MALMTLSLALDTWLQQCTGPVLQLPEDTVEVEPGAVEVEVTVTVIVVGSDPQRLAGVATARRPREDAKRAEVMRILTR